MILYSSSKTDVLRKSLSRKYDRPVTLSWQVTFSSHDDRVFVTPKTSNKSGSEKFVFRRKLKHARRVIMSSNVRPFHLICASGNSVFAKAFVVLLMLHNIHLICFEHNFCPLHLCYIGIIMGSNNWGQKFKLLLYKINHHNLSTVEFQLYRIQIM